MNFFDKLTSRAKPIRQGLEVGGGVGGAAVSLLAPSFQRSVVKAQSATIDAYAEVNARRVARSVRYQQGNAAVANAAGGGSQYGSYLSIVADNARAGEEQRQNVFLQAENQKIALRRGVTTNVEAGLGFTSKLLGAAAKVGGEQFKGDFT